MTLKRYIFPLNSIPSYFNGGLSFVAFSIVEGNAYIFCGITKTYTLIISLFSIKNFMNSCKIGYIQDDKCSLCKTDSESLYHIFFECRHTKQFCKKFQYYFYTLTREFVCLTLQKVITGILYINCPLLNYLILIAKLYLWACKRTQTLPVVTAFSSKVEIMYETEKYIYVLKLTKWTNLIRSGLRLWTLYPSVVCT